MNLHPIRHVPRIDPPEGRFFRGANTAPDGSTLDVDHISLLRNGRRWLPVMGEIHYARTDPRDWREALSKMQAGGIDIVASYVFWIHHEEREGEWDWSGCRNLRKFVQTCADLRFPIIVRCGPWCHGEVRNGGLPDWILTKDLKTRTNDPKYLAHARTLYSQIARQLLGLLFKDGGPVIGVQIENEFPGPSEHLLTLRNIAMEAGLDVPFYTRTGWPSPATPIPFGEILPLFGAYPDGFWARSIDEMPGHFWRAFRFDRIRTDDEVGADMLGSDRRTDDADTPQYPYLTCELGGGMEQAYHRRVRIDPMDILSVVMSRLGSGSNLPGYYMYHGGTNPQGKLSTLQESQATGYWNDSPVKSYDFQAPLGQHGQVREHYHLLRRVHSFTRGFGESLAMMSSSLPDAIPQQKEDTKTLRFAIRSDGRSGFLFVNNYQRLTEMPAKPDAQFEIELPGETLRLPGNPLTIPANSTFVFPFNLDLGGAQLIYATAQLLARSSIDGIGCFYFFEVPGIEATFAFSDGVRIAKPSREIAFKVGKPGREVAVVVLSHQDSLNFINTPMGARFLEASEQQHMEIPATLIKTPGPWRKISMGHAKVAEAPGEEAFADAGIWKIKLPPDIGLSRDRLLRVHYIGDVARFYLNGALVSDNFYNGLPCDLSLREMADAGTREVELRILPLQKESPIYLDRRAQPDFGDQHSIARVDRVEIIGPA